MTMGDKMKEKFEDLVKLIHDFQIKGGEAQVERRERELIEAQNRLQVLREDDSKARALAGEITDLASRAKEQ